MTSGQTTPTIPREPVAGFSNPRAIFYPWTRYPVVEIIVGVIVLAMGAFFVYCTLWVTPKPTVVGAAIAVVIFLPMGLFFIGAGIARWRWKNTYIRLTGTKPW